MIEQAFRWLGATSVGIAMRDTTWGFAIVETLHLLGLAGLGGAVLITNLSASGILLRRVDPQTVARAAKPLLIGSLLTMIGSGVLLVSSKPVRYYLDNMFRAKMALLAAAVISTILIWRLLSRSDRPRGALLVLAAASLLFWLSVGVAGRLIGFL